MTEDLSEEVSTIESLRALALEHGFDYASGDPSLVDRWSAPPFSDFGHRRALDVVYGERDGFPVVAFRFVVGESARDGKAEASYGGGIRMTLPAVQRSHLVVAVALPGPLPRVSLVPTDDPVDDDPFGYVFETEDEGLAARYDVYGVDGDAASALLHLDAVTAIRKHRTVDWRLDGRDLLAVEPADAPERSVEEILETIDALTTIAKGIPTDLYGKYSPRRTYPPRD